MTKKFFLGLCIVLVLVFSVNVHSALTDNLIVYYPMNDTGTTVVNAVNNGLTWNGTATGTTANVDGYIGKARSSNGLINNYVNMNNGLLNTVNATFSFWARSYTDMTTGTLRGPFSTKTTQGIRFEHNGISPANYYLAGEPLSVSGPFRFNPNVTNAVSRGWNMYTVVISTDRIDIYLNGAWSMGSIETYSANKMNNFILFYAYENAAIRTWNGVIDEVTLHNRSLSSSEISQIYNCSIANITILNCYTVPPTPINNITFVSQNPTNLTATTLFSQRLNITYNFTNPQQFINSSGLSGLNTLYYNITNPQGFINTTALSSLNTLYYNITNPVGYLNLSSISQTFYNKTETDSKYVATSGSTMTGNLTMGTNCINLGAGYICGNSTNVWMVSP